VSFSADWLSLREPYDRRARNGAVVDAVAATFVDQTAINVVDLACGTGSTLRALMAHLPPQQNWRLFDNDLGLLGRAAMQERPAHVAVTTTPVDLVRDLELALDGAVDLVTTSALLDLVSEEWLERFVVEAAARRLPVYAALTYDGRAMLAPADPRDDDIVAAVNRHQRRDKGFGPALGPTAAAAAIASLNAVGYVVVQGTSDWVFDTDDREIQAEVLSGWATAARESGDVDVGEIAGWLTRRRELLAAGRATMQVGHIDVLARPIGTR
jgi:Methyltransferase domain